MSVRSREARGPALVGPVVGIYFPECSVRNEDSPSRYTIVDLQAFFYRFSASVQFRQPNARTNNLYCRGELGNRLVRSRFCVFWFQLLMKLHLAPRWATILLQECEVYCPWKGAWPCFLYQIRPPLYLIPYPRQNLTYCNYLKRGHPV